MRPLLIGLLAMTFFYLAPPVRAFFLPQASAQIPATSIKPLPGTSQTTQKLIHFNFPAASCSEKKAFACHRRFHNCQVRAYVTFGQRARGCKKARNPTECRRTTNVLWSAYHRTCKNLSIRCIEAC